MTYISPQCDTCDTYMYTWEDANEGIEYTCPKCAYEDLPKHIMERFPEYKTQNICLHFNWNDNCNECHVSSQAIENTQGLIDKSTLRS